MFFRGRRGEPKDRRRTARVEQPALAAFYWTGGVSTPCRVCNICRKGAYIESDQEWFTGTVVHLVLEPRVPAGPGDATVRGYLLEHYGTEIGGGFATPTPSSEAHRTFGLWARIVHTDSRGMGMEFVMTDREEELAFNLFLDAALGGRAAK
jgi:hypothetical protein